MPRVPNKGQEISEISGESCGVIFLFVKRIYIIYPSQPTRKDITCYVSFGFVDREKVVVELEALF